MDTDPLEDLFPLLKVLDPASQRANMVEAPLSCLTL